MSVRGRDAFDLSSASDGINGRQGEYLLRGRVQCQGGPNGAVPEYTSTPLLRLIYDTLPPALMTDVSKLTAAVYPPGALVTVAFSEALLCQQPAPWSVALYTDSSRGTKLFSSEGSFIGGQQHLVVACEGAALSFLVPSGLSSATYSSVYVEFLKITDQNFNEAVDTFAFTLKLKAEAWPPPIAGVGLRSPSPPPLPPPPRGKKSPPHPPSPRPPSPPSPRPPAVSPTPRPRRSTPPHPPPRSPAPPPPPPPPTSTPTPPAGQTPPGGKRRLLSAARLAEVERLQALRRSAAAAVQAASAGGGGSHQVAHEQEEEKEEDGGL